MRIVVVALGIGAAAWLQGPVGEANAARRTNDFRYTPDPALMRVVAGAHTSTFADMLWLRALPDMSRPFEDRAMKKRWIAGATEVVTDLEPTFGTVYSFGAAHLNLVDRNPDAAIELLQKGVERNPRSAGLHVALAMQHYEYRKDKKRTIELLEKASTMDDIDSLSLAMLAALKVDARDDFMAIATWAKAADEAPNAAVKALCEFELWRTKALIAMRAANEFEKTRGRRPSAPEDLRDPVLMSASVFDVVLEGLELDATGRPRYAKLDELQVAQRVAQADQWIAGFRAEHDGRAPTEAEFLESFGIPPTAPKGRRWRYADGKLSLDAE